jgi:hypothetical protein
LQKKSRGVQMRLKDERQSSAILSATGKSNQNQTVLENTRSSISIALTENLWKKLRPQDN